MMLGNAHWTYLHAFFKQHFLEINWGKNHILLCVNKLKRKMYTWEKAVHVCFYRVTFQYVPSWGLIDWETKFLRLGQRIS